MDKLYEALVFYSENLMNRQFICCIKKKDETRKIVIRFSKRDFQHLIGLHKIKGIEQIKDIPDLMFSKIKNRILTIDLIKNNKEFVNIEKRIEYFSEMKNFFVNNNDYLRDSEKGWNSIAAKYMFSKFKKNTGYVHLFVVDNKYGYFSPMSFFIQEDGLYLKLSKSYWRIESVEEDMKFKINNPVNK